MTERGAMTDVNRVLFGFKNNIIRDLDVCSRSSSNSSSCCCCCSFDCLFETCMYASSLGDDVELFNNRGLLPCLHSPILTRLDC